MKFNLKEITKVKVSKNREEDCYLYESEDGAAIVQFNVGKEAWTWQLGLATNSTGQDVAKKVIEAFCRVGHSLVGQHIGGDSEEMCRQFDEGIKILEVK